MPGVLQSFSRLMFRANVPKVLQNQLYDNFVLSYGLGIPIRSVAEDTLIKGWSIYAELGRSARDAGQRVDPPAPLERRLDVWRSRRGPLSRLRHGLRRRPSKSARLRTLPCTVPARPLPQDDRAADPIPLHGAAGDPLRPGAGPKRCFADTVEQIKPVGDRLAASAGKELRGEKGSLSPSGLMKALYTDKGYAPNMPGSREATGSPTS